MESIIKSPLAPGSKTEFLRKIKSNKIIRQYKKAGIDISYLLKEHKSISVFKCLKTGYKFYYPFDIAGDSVFYEHFQKFDWYYMPWKWEHEVTTNYLEDGQSVLEVGCAHGAFLKKINELYKLEECIGLELNKTTGIKNSQWKIVNQYVQDFQKNNQGKFDIVCSYQVLEHISEVYSFIEAKVNCLKQGGKLIISVPNNESYLKHLDSALNRPPHHMGLWDAKSLESLTSIFPLKIDKIHYEELQTYHIGGYIQAQFNSKFNYFNSNDNYYVARFMAKLYKLTGKYQKIKTKIENEKHAIKGHTILVVFEKI